MDIPYFLERRSTRRPFRHNVEGHTIQKREPVLVVIGVAPQTGDIVSIGFGRNEGTGPYQVREPSDGSV